jgi:hypothetical protein
MTLSQPLKWLALLARLDRAKDASPFFCGTRSRYSSVTSRPR